MPKSIVEQSFDQSAQTWDDKKLKLVPFYQNTVGLILKHISFPSHQPLQILEIGTGTGQLAELLLHQYPKASYLGLDLSDEMIKLAKNRLMRLKNNIKIRKIDLNKASLSGKFDFIISFYTIHHLENKRQFFKDACSALKKTGLLIYVDIVVANQKKLEQKYLKHWKEFMQKNEIKKAEIDYIFEDHRNNDLPETVETQLLMLKKAGFKTYDLLWKHEKFAAFYAQK